MANGGMPKYEVRFNGVWGEVVFCAAFLLTTNVTNQTNGSDKLTVQLEGPELRDVSLNADSSVVSSPYF